jgi:Flp pilus assembly pilin Flp
MPLRRDQRGANLVEYILIVGLLALVALGGFRQLEGSASDRATAHAQCVAALSCGDGSVTGAPAVFGATAPPMGSTAETNAAQTAAQPSSPPPSAPRSLGERALDVGKGFVVDGLWGTITGIGTMIAHPIQTAQAVGSAIAHPVQTATAIKDAVVTAWDENPERLIGAGLFEVVTLPVAAIKATKASRLGTLTRATTAADRLDDAGDAARIAGRADDVGGASQVDNAAAAAARTTDKFAISEEQFIQMARQGGLQPERMTVYRFDSRPPDVIANEGGLFPNPTKPPATSVEQHFEFGSTGSGTFVSTTVQEGNRGFVLGSDAPKTMVGLTDEQLIQRMETRLPNPDAPLPPPVEYVIYEYRGETLAARTNATVHVHEQEALTRGISTSEGLQVREVRVQRPWRRVGVEDWEPGETVGIQMELPKNSSVTFGDWTPVGRTP